MFTEHIKSVVDRVDGGIGGVLMGLDGIPVETYLRDASMDVNTLGMEFAYIMTQIRKASAILELGDINEFSVRAESLVLVVRMLNDEYFLAIVLASDGNYGKARFLMRVASPRLIAEL